MENSQGKRRQDQVSVLSTGISLSMTFAQANAGPHFFAPRPAPASTPNPKPAGFLEGLFNLVSAGAQRFDPAPEFKAAPKPQNDFRPNAP